MFFSGPDLATQARGHVVWVVTTPAVRVVRDDVARVQPDRRGDLLAADVAGAHYVRVQLQPVRLPCHVQRLQDG
jgi:hypothetical protein